MSDAQLNATDMLKRWVLNLRIGNDPAPETWTEIHEKIDRMPEAEREALRSLIPDLLNELDHGTN